MKEFGAEVPLLFAEWFQFAENFLQDSIKGAPTSGVSK